jgi:hypothetical protein
MRATDSGDGIFYNVGIATKHKQTETNDNVKLFRYALLRIAQNLVNQKHIWVMPNHFDNKVLVVRVAPNFTYPKGKVQQAAKDYPKVLAAHLNLVFGDCCSSSRSQITFHRDINFKHLVTSVMYADVKSNLLERDDINMCTPCKVPGKLL